MNKTYNPFVYPSGDGERIEFDAGLRLRDYFAAHALRLDWIADSQLNAESTAQWAYEVADAMLKERAK